MKDNEPYELQHVFEKICNSKPCMDFGEPFTSVFRVLHNGGDNEILAASYTCSLFLSAIRAGFPTERLHTFVRYAQDHYGRFHFDCRMYDRIVGLIDKERYGQITLLDSKCNIVKAEYSDNDIKEALDFYTNR